MPFGSQNLIKTCQRELCDSTVVTADSLGHETNVEPAGKKIAGEEEAAESGTTMESQQLRHSRAKDVIELLQGSQKT